MAKADHYTEPASGQIMKLLDRAAYSTTSRGSVFAAWLRMCVAALAGGTMEDDYMDAIKPYLGRGEKVGERPVDHMAHAFGLLMHAYEQAEPYTDIVGDMFQGGITFGEHGQFYTPQCLCDLMASVSMGDPDDEDRQPIRTVNDPACGSGRMLLGVAKAEPYKTLFTRSFYGQDIDLRCVQMTAINFAVWGLRGQVTWGNTLTLEENRVYVVNSRDALALASIETPGKFPALIRSYVPEKKLTPMQAVSKAVSFKKAAEAMSQEAFINGVMPCINTTSETPPRKPAKRGVAETRSLFED